MKKIRWNAKKGLINLGLVGLFGFFFYEFICFLNDVIVRCCMYYD